MHPLPGNDASLGVLAALAPRARRPSQMQERTLLAGAKLLAMALQNLRIRERARREAQELQKLVITDELTRLYNRRFLDEYLRVQVPLAERRGGGLAFVALDIDHFKRVNDTYGHEAGDRVLAGIAGQLRLASRSCDLPVRMGGEEFLVVIAEHEIDGAMAFAERLRVAIAELDFNGLVPGGGLHVTVSIGVALFGLHGSDAATLMRASDEAMYASKHGGRDRVSLSTALPVLPG
jgi:diguanylate cyclase (GGDEF)-like protein